MLSRTISLHLLQGLAPVLPRFERPIFVLSAPRSGSSHLFEVIKRLSSVLTFEREADFVWWRVFPYSRLPIPTDYIEREECSEQKTKQIRSLIVLELLRMRRASYQDMLRCIILREPVRYAEKTIANCFHLDVINEIFPDALFIHLVRDARACISSMIEGWNSRKFMERKVPVKSGSTITYWKYPIPPKWHTVTKQSIPEICAWSWAEHNRFVLDKLHSDCQFARSYLRVTYEELVGHPEQVTERTAKFVGLHCTKACLDYLRDNHLSWATVSPPKRDKWKERNLHLVNSVIPTIAPMMQQLGYTKPKCELPTYRCD
jgi:hypothetical protein